MKQCPYCDTILEDKAAFCGHCGTKLPSPPQLPQAPYQQPYQQPQIIIAHAPVAPNYTTRVVIYNGESQMMKGIRSWQQGGWEVVSTEHIDQGYSASKTCCLGALFLPLALLGKNSAHFKVTYRMKIA